MDDGVPDVLTGNAGGHDLLDSGHLELFIFVDVDAVGELLPLDFLEHDLQDLVGENYVVVGFLVGVTAHSVGQLDELLASHAVLYDHLLELLLYEPVLLLGLHVLVLLQQEVVRVRQEEHLAHLQVHPHVVPDLIQQS